MWVFVLDIAKGALATGLGLLVDGRPAGYALGAAAVVGHVFPAWQRFRGGKGVATAGGVAATLTPIVFVALLLLWFAISTITKKASVASIIIVLLLPVGVAIEQRELWEVIAIIAISILVMARHLDNIERLLKRREPALREGRPD